MLGTVEVVVLALIAYTALFIAVFAGVVLAFLVAAVFIMKLLGAYLNRLSTADSDK